VGIDPAMALGPAAPLSPALQPRLALVTGGGRGIGRACALTLAEQGWHLLVCGRDEAALRAVVADIQARGGQAQWLAGDLADETFWRALQALPVRPELLLHNACQPARFGLVEAVPLPQVHGVIDSVLVAGLRLAQWALPAMKQAHGGRLIYIGSAAARLGAHGQVAYAAAKAGLQGMVRSLAVETARHGITCNLIEPGFIETERTRSAVAPALQATLASRAAAGRAGSDQEVAQVVAFLASEGASYITGATLPVDGGYGLGLVPGAPGVAPARAPSTDAQTNGGTQ